MHFYALAMTISALLTSNPAKKQECLNLLYKANNLQTDHVYTQVPTEDPDASSDSSTDSDDGYFAENEVKSHEKSSIMSFYRISKKKKTE